MAASRDFTGGAAGKMTQVIRAREMLPGASGNLLGRRKPGIIGSDGRRVVSDDLADELASYGLRPGNCAYEDARDDYMPYEAIDGSGKTFLGELTRGARSTSNDLMVDAGVPVTHAVMVWCGEPSMKGKPLYPRWIIWDRCGERPYSITSLYAGMDMFRVINQIGPPPWEPAVRMRLISVTTQSDRQCYRLRIVE